MDENGDLVRGRSHDFKAVAETAYKRAEDAIKAGNAIEVQDWATMDRARGNKPKGSLYSQLNFSEKMKEKLKKHDQSGSVTIDGHTFLSLRVKFYDDEVSDAPSSEAEPAKMTATASRKPAAIDKDAEPAPSSEAELETDGFDDDMKPAAIRGRRRNATDASNYDVDIRPDPLTDEEDVTYINQTRKKKRKQQAGSLKRRRTSKKKEKKSQPRKSKYDIDLDFEDETLSDSSDSTLTYDEDSD